MINLSFVRALCLALLFPAVASAAALDDYYLAKFGQQSPLYKSLEAVSATGAGEADRCRTPLFRRLKRDWKLLESETQKALAKYVTRPTLSGEKTCTPVNGHFTIHYTTTGANAVDTTDNNGNGVPDWVETVAGVFEYVYDVEVNKMGYLAPPDTSYDVYLMDLAPQNVYGYTQNDGAGATSISYPSYIEIDKSFTASAFVNARGGPYAPITSLRITAAHEFHHAIQFAMNAYFDTSYGEMTSTWMEDEVYDSGNQLYIYLDSYLHFTSTIGLDAVGDGGSEYGRWIFNRYLAETQGSRTAIRAVWRELAQNGVPLGATSPDQGIEIPIPPVINTVLQGNLGNNFFGFAKRVVLKNWLSHLTDIARIPSVTPTATFTTTGAVQAPINALPTSYSFAVYKYLPSTINGALEIDFTGLSSSVAVSALEINTLGVTDYPYDPVGQKITVPSFGAGDTVYLVVCNNGGAMGSPVVVSPAFPADNSTVADGAGLGTDGLALDANRLAIPAQSVSSSKSGGGGGCFIATAAYGSYLHPKVAELRAFRDRYLMTNAPGRLFVAAYYRLSPPIAEVIARHEWMKSGVRCLLLPLILAVEHPAAALGLLLLVLGVTLRWGVIFVKGKMQEAAAV
ncbi:hypothetical protein KP004_07090 [Geomonas oryzisoli]|uniref:Uncharacterized protein n=1 Tax=Geomonas oryzisoli TaxID=2847992 RepID=A0ABX8JCY5_9BACT|nr:MXAN_6640 family putative metalloprotease [Geomonas oryzisoli]QWV94936.1 hypothetical protein KP004_07090 [Geomonas oryzisoli]